MQLPRLSLLSQVSIVHFISHVHMMILPALMPLMSTTTELSFVQIGFAISVFGIVSAIVQAPIGFFVDKLGPKRVLMAGLLLGSFSFISIGLVNHYAWLVFAMGLAGVANGVYHPSDYALLSQNIEDERMGRAFSMHTFSGFLGTAITPIIAIAIASITSISFAFVLTGGIGLVSVIILLPQAKRKTTTQGDTRSVSRLTQAKSQPHISKRSLFTASLFLMFLLFLLMSLSGGAVQNFSVSALVTDYAFTLAEANIALTAFLLLNAAGVLVGGQLADYTQRHGLIAAIALVITAFLAMSVATLPFSNLALVIVMAVMGGLSGIIAPSRDMLVRAAAPVGAEGRAFGLVSTGFNFGSTIGPILFGWLIDHGHARGIFWAAAVFMLLTALIAIYQEIKGVKR